MSNKSFVGSCRGHSRLNEQPSVTLVGYKTYVELYGECLTYWKQNVDFRRYDDSS